MHMDADLLIGAHGNAVTNSEPYRVALCKNNCRAGNRGLRTVSGGNVSAVNLMLDHSIREQSVSVLFTGHFNAMIGGDCLPRQKSCRQDKDGRNCHFGAEAPEWLCN